MTTKSKKDVVVFSKEEKEILLSDIYMDVSQSKIGENMTEEQIREYSLQAYTKVHNSFEKSFTPKAKAHFGLNSYLDGIMGRTIRSANITKKYNSDSVNRFLENPQLHKNELLRMGLYLYTRVQEYKGIIEYKSNMLPFSNILRPNNVDEDFNVDNYKKNLQFIVDYTIPYKFGRAVKKLVRDDVYFAYELSDGSGKNFIWKELPVEYCLILGRDRFQTYRVGFDFRYFDTFPNDLESFPQEFTDMYNSYKATRVSTLKNNKDVRDFGTDAILELDSNKAIAFKFDESVDFVLPFYSGLYVDMLRLVELKEIEMVSTVSDNYKLIHQRIPLNPEAKGEDDYLLSGEEIIDGHDGLRANVPEGIGVATTGMEVNGITLKSNVGSAEENIVSKHINNLLASSGTSKILFNGNSTSAVGLEKNIQVDENMLFKLLRQFELYMNKKLFLYNKGAYKYRLQFLDHTYYNTDLLYERFLQMGQFGFNTEFETSAVAGVSQLDFINNGSISEKLGFKKQMIPFQSSHTNTDTAGGGAVGGKKVASKLTEEGARSRSRGL